MRADPGSPGCSRHCSLQRVGHGVLCQSRCSGTSASQAVCSTSHTRGSLRRFDSVHTGGYRSGRLETCLPPCRTWSKLAPQHHIFCGAPLALFPSELLALLRRNDLLPASRSGRSLHVLCLARHRQSLKSIISQAVGPDMQPSAVICTVVMLL